ncbi:MAG: class I adenylate-forming enzyme family protein, partial [Pseudomonadota bacterium]
MIPTLRRELHFDDRVVACFADRPPNLVAMLEQAFRTHPTNDAVVDTTRRLTFAELDRLTAGLARHLQDQGLERGDRLGLQLPNGWPFVALLVAALRAGIVPVPLNPRATGSDVAFILADCAAKALATSQPDKAPPGLPRLPADPESLEAHAINANAAPVRLREEDPAVLLYTSGTTGRPKGAILTHLNLVHTCLHYRLHFGLGPTDKALLAVPGAHVTGLAALIFAPLASAGTVLALESFDVTAFLEMAAAERMTWTILVPAMYNLCLLRANLRDYDLAHWRIGAYGGAPMPEATIQALGRQLPALALVNAYGATETTSPTTLVPLDDGGRHTASVGQPVACAEVRIMDDDGREVPEGQLGEVWIKGPMVVPGYWNRPDETAKAFTAGFWRSGDVGSMEQGYLRLYDRKKDLINRGGYKVFSIEVENVLQTHPAVADAAVIPAPDPVLGELVHAFVHLEHEVTGKDLRTHCAKYLADYKLPDTFT